MTDDFQPSPRASSIFLREDTRSALQKHLVEAGAETIVAIHGTIVDFAAIRIYVEDDFTLRKERAILEAMEGRSCIYEGQDGELLRVPAARNLPPSSLGLQ